MVRMPQGCQVCEGPQRDSLKLEISSRESRKTLDTQETYKAFGPLIIDFSKIQSKIGVKYDNWHQDLLRKFGQIIQTVASDFHTNIAEVLARPFTSLLFMPLLFSIGISSKANPSIPAISTTACN